MKKKWLLLLGILFLNCFESNSTKELIEEKYSQALAKVQDSLVTIIQDTSKLNPILEKLISKYDLAEELKHYRQNPFSSTIPEPKKQTAPVRQRRVVVQRAPRSEIAGLKLSGIIERGGVRKALINSNIYTVGDRIRTLQIKEIGRKHIILAGKTKTYRMSLKEK